MAKSHSSQNDTTEETIFAYQTNTKLLRYTDKQKEHKASPAPTIPANKFKYIPSGIVRIQPHCYTFDKRHFFRAAKHTLAEAKKRYPAANVISILKLQVKKSEITSSGIHLKESQIKEITVHTLENTATPMRAFAYFEGDITHFLTPFGDIYEKRSTTRDDSDEEDSKEQPDCSPDTVVGKIDFATTVRAIKETDIAALPTAGQQPNKQLFKVTPIKHAALGEQPVYYYENLQIAKSRRRIAKIRRVYAKAVVPCCIDMPYSIKNTPINRNTPDKYHSILTRKNFTDKDGKAFQSEEKALYEARRVGLSTPIPSHRTISILTFDLPITSDQKLDDQDFADIELYNAVQAKVFQPKTKICEKTGVLISTVDFHQPTKTLIPRDYHFRVMPHHFAKIFSDVKETPAGTPEDPILANDRSKAPHLPTGPLLNNTSKLAPSSEKQDRSAVNGSDNKATTTKLLAKLTPPDVVITIASLSPAKASPPATSSRAAAYGTNPSPMATFCELAAANLKFTFMSATQNIGTVVSVATTTRVPTPRPKDSPSFDAVTATDKLSPPKFILAK